MDAPQSTHDATRGSGPLVARNIQEHEICALDPPQSPSRTLLPSPIASAVSFATRSTSLALRLGTFVGVLSLGAAKVTTLSSLELGRAVLEGLLSRAGRDVVARSQSDLARVDAETIIERSLEALHSTMSQVVFWTTTGFHLTRNTVSTVSQVSQILLSVLDQFFGSTDSSRAIASIITLVRREFQNPATGVPGEKVGVIDLIVGTLGLAYLQVWCRKLIREEAQRLGQEEVVWDVVVLNGERVDVHQDSLYGIHRGAYTQAGIKPLPQDPLVGVVEGHEITPDTSDEDELPEAMLKQQILRSLPRDANVSITTHVTTTKTITVEVKGHQNLPPTTLPGLDMVEREIYEGNDLASADMEPTYKVVYRAVRNRVKNKHHHGRQEDDLVWAGQVSDGEDSDRPLIEDITAQEPEDRPPAVPPKSNPSSPPLSGSGPTLITPENLALQQHLSSMSDSSTLAPSSPPRDRPSHIPVPKQSPENIANQKRTRRPLEEERQPARDGPSPPHVKTKRENKRHNGGDGSSTKPPEKRAGFKSALKKRSVTSFSNILSRDPSSDNLASSNKPKSSIKPPWGSNKASHAKTAASQPRAVIPIRNSSLIPAREPPRAPQRGNPNFFSSRDLGDSVNYPQLIRSPSGSSFVSASGLRRRNSVVSQTETFSIHSYGSRPPSPTMQRAEFKSTNSHLGPKHDGDHDEPLMRAHNRSRSQINSWYAPSIHTLKTSASQTSLIIPTHVQRSAYGDSESVDSLRRNGRVDGMFPDFHILRNITRYSRYASAAYGSNFLRYMGISKDMPVLKALDDRHTDLRYFTHHTELPPDSILLSSFVDPQGGSDYTGSTDTGIPLVHTIALDEESKAVVLACRGTLGFDDVLVDMMCEYDDLFWRGKTYKVHKGIHASARRLLYGGDGRVLITLKEALEEFPDYGLILCGHSLGGAVTALLGAMLAEPAMSGPSFVTSAHQHRRLLSAGPDSKSDPPICLPSGRPIHVYAYGPPATMSPSLQKATRGLITSTVHGNDLVPHLSLGVLHDLQAVALAFKTDNSEAKAEVRRHIVQGLQAGFADKWYNNAPKTATGEETQWAFAALKTLRASMMSPKLIPPGEVFSVECSPALRRDAFLRVGEEQIGRPATRVVLKYIRDVETRFREIRFGASMLMDHSPGRYEDALKRLALGVVGY